ncbi:MAG: type II toxin-antitoxin system VapC family toxin [Promethearchaeota archaeon]
MIVVDTSVFIDHIFEYDSNRTKIADNFFNSIQKKELPMFEPTIFKIELIGQLVRRMKKPDALTAAKDFFSEINFVEDSELFDIAFSIAYETGARASDSYYVSVAKIKKAVLVSNDNIQIQTARKFGIEAYYLVEDLEKIRVKFEDK